MPAALKKCPESTHPPEDDGYAIAIQAKITDIEIDNGWDEKLQTWSSVATGISATACGLMELPSLAVTIPKDKLVFDTSNALIRVSIGGVQLFKPEDLALTLAATADATTTITGVRPVAGDAGGQLKVAATTSVLAHVINGPKANTLDCPLALTTGLSTDRLRVQPEGRGLKGPTLTSQPEPAAWTVQGAPLDGPLVGAKAFVAGNNFPVPFFKNSQKCYPGDLFTNVFSGYDAKGINYPDSSTLVQHPAGTGWVSGKLEITALDDKALLNGPPTTVPGS